MTSPLAKKLRLQPGQRVSILNAPKGYVKSLGTLPEGAELAHKGHELCDFLQLFVESAEELREQAPAALRAIKPEGILWVSYPKRASGSGSDLTRDIVWEIMTEHGLRAVAQVAVSSVWSAIRFRSK